MRDIRSSLVRLHISETEDRRRAFDTIFPKRWVLLSNRKLMGFVYLQCGRGTKEFGTGERGGILLLSEGGLKKIFLFCQGVPLCVGRS